MQTEVTKPGIQTDYRCLLEVNKQALADAGMLDEYTQKRGDKFNEDGNDYINLLQAKLLGLLDF